MQIEAPPPKWSRSFFFQNDSIQTHFAFIEFSLRVWGSLNISLNTNEKNSVLFLSVNLIRPVGTYSPSSIEVALACERNFFLYFFVSYSASVATNNNLLADLYKKKKKTATLPPIMLWGRKFISQGKISQIASRF